MSLIGTNGQSAFSQQNMTQQNQLGQQAQGFTFTATNGTGYATVPSWQHTYYQPDPILEFIRIVGNYPFQFQKIENGYILAAKGKIYVYKQLDDMLVDFKEFMK